MQSTVNFLRLNCVWWNVPENSVPHCGYSLYPSMNTAFCTKESSVCLSRYGWQIRTYNIYCFTVHVVTPYPYIMWCVVKRVVSHIVSQWDPRLKYQPTCWERCARTPVLRLGYSHLVTKHNNYTQPIQTALLGWVKEGKGSGLWGKWHFLTLGYFTLAPAPFYWNIELATVYRLHENTKDVICCSFPGNATYNMWYAHDLKALWERNCLKLW